MDKDVKKQKAEFLIKVDSDGENYMGDYGGEGFVSVVLKIDYHNESYKIKIPRVYIETDCKYPLFLAKAIEKAYSIVQYELYQKNIEK